MDTHILLVSEQAAPNILPALDAELRPDKAILIVTGKMRQRAESLSRVLNEAGVATRSLDLPDEHDFGHMEEVLLNLATETGDDEITVNLTGGTKLMALAAQSVATTAGWKQFYVDLDTDEVIWLQPRGNRHHLQESLRLPHYLASYGIAIAEKIQRPTVSEAEQRLCGTLLREIGSLERPIGQLNLIAQKAQERGALTIAVGDCIPTITPALEALLRNFEAAGILNSLAGDRIRFPNEAARNFAKGGWLEQHVADTLNALHGTLGLRDKAINLQIRDRSGVRNELDAAFLSRNRLFIIESKTQRMDDRGDSKATDTLFKLAEICRFTGGTGARGMLASYRRLNEHERLRARALGIRLVEGAELVALSEHIRRWVGE